MPCTILWLRRDLRLADHPALAWGLARGGAVIPVFVLDPVVDSWGAAARWRLGAGLAAMARALGAAGSRLILRRGEASATLAAIAREVGADAVTWTRLYDPAAKARDAEVKASLRARGLTVESRPGHTLFEPWEIATAQGGSYRVYTPFWRALSAREVSAPLRAPDAIPTPGNWPRSERLEDWALGAAMNRGGAVVAARASVGEAAARAALDAFLDERLAAYPADRDRMDRAGGSGLSENLALGEISARTVWHATCARGPDAPGAEAFLREIAWRDFAWSLLHHAPRLAEANWREEWDAFPWRGDNDDAEAWRRGMTGEPAIDAAMRELYVTGRMHNRARMLVASYLTKHLMTHWRVGEAWFRETLTDWDPASNAMGWQWAAGSGPDAAPFFRIFNPATQAARFDPEGAWRRRWIAEHARRPGADALAFFDAAPLGWGLSPDQPYPRPIVDLAEGRQRALAAYKALRATA